MGVAGAVAARVRSLVARRQHPRVVITDGPLTGTHAQSVLDGLAAAPLPQPDNTTCGPSCLVLERMLRDPAYAAGIVDEDDPVAEFARRATALHHETNRPWDGHRVHVPWPRSLGTRPDAVARLLSSPRGFGASGRRYEWPAVDPKRPRPVYDAVAGTAAAGEPVVLFIGSDTLPRHVVLVVGTSGAADATGLRCYDPSRGDLVDVGQDAFTSATLDVAGWDTPWLAVLPA